MKLPVPNMFTPEGVENYISQQESFDPKDVEMAYPGLKVVSTVQAAIVLGYTSAKIAGMLVKTQAERRETAAQLAAMGEQAVAL